MLNGPNMDPSQGINLDFSNEFPFIYIEDNATLRLRNVTVTGIYNKYSPDLSPTLKKWPRPLGFELWPALVPRAGSTVILTNMMFYIVFKDSAQRGCSKDYLQEVTLSQSSVLGGPNSTGYVPELNATWVNGYHKLSLGIEGAADNARPIAMTLVINGTGCGCLVAPQQAQQAVDADTTSQGNASEPPSSTVTNNGGLSAGAWAGIGVGIAIAVLAAGLITRQIVRRGKHRPLMLPDPRNLPPKPPESPSHVQAFDAVERINSGHTELTIASALRIRFGTLDGLEIGPLIGRGAFGRIYKGSMRGTPVAVKVVDHAVDEGSSAAAAAAAADITSEVVLLTALAHPNIVRVFRVATIKLEDRCSSFGSTNGRFSNNIGSNNIIESGTATGSERDLEIGIENSNAFLGTGSDGYTASNLNINKNGGINSPAGTRSSPSSGGVSGTGTSPVGSNGQNSSLGSGEPKGLLGLSGPGLYETWMVMEFCEKGSLHDAIQRRRFHRRDGSANKVRKRLKFIFLLNIEVSILYCILIRSWRVGWSINFVV